MADVSIEKVVTVDSDLVDAFARLIPQLSARAVPPSASALEKVVDSPASVLLVAKDREARRIIAAMTVGVVRSTTGTRCFFEDIIVESQSRGRGIGRRLCEEAIEIAAAFGADTIDLTSHESREAANRLYRRIGFAPRETNLYRLALPKLPR